MFKLLKDIMCILNVDENQKVNKRLIINIICFIVLSMLHIKKHLLLQFKIIKPILLLL